MLKHIVFFTAKNPTDIDAIYNGLKILESIPCGGTIRIYKNNKIDQIDNRVDVVVYGEFSDARALKTYKSNPIYQQSIDIVRPLRDMRVAADFDV